jgi:FixJ family two-component response regulator
MTAPATIAPPAASVLERPLVLFVDDEPAVLEALAVNLHRGFRVVTAPSGEAGLAKLDAEQGFSVVVSDMRMPKMDGAAFLALARDAQSEAVRVLLTGHTDIESAVRVVNHGQIFRFLTKPCGRDTLRSTINDAVTQHRLITSERVLLEQTLRGSIKMLVDVLAITNPTAFGRANLIKSRVLELAGLLGVTETWQLELAALASQLGAIVLPHELCEKIERGHALTNEEERVVSRAPEMTEQLLANIPRLEVVRAMLALHIQPPRRNPGADATRRLIELGAHLLRVTIDLAALESTAAGSISAVKEILMRTDRYDSEVLKVIEQLYHVRTPRFVVKAIPPHALRAGMVLAEDVRMASATLLVARGYEITASFINRIKNFPHGAFAGEFRIGFPC